MHIDDFLVRLPKVRQSKEGQWSAICPAHEDKSASLGIKDAGDRILVHCFAGCRPEDICASLGLELHDLFADGQPARPIGLGVSRKKLLFEADVERLILEQCSAKRDRGEPLTEAEAQRETLAIERLAIAWRALA